MSWKVEASASANNVILETWENEEESAPTSN